MTENSKIFIWQHLFESVDTKCPPFCSGFMVSYCFLFFRKNWWHCESHQQEDSGAYVTEGIPGQHPGHQFCAPCLRAARGRGREGPSVHPRPQGDRTGQDWVSFLTNWWFSARLQYLQRVSNGDTAVLHLAIKMRRDGHFHHFDPADDIDELVPRGYDTIRNNVYAVDPLWPLHTIWCRRTWAILVKVNASYLTAPRAKAVPGRYKQTLKF